MPQLDARVAELASKYRPLAVEIYKEISIPIPAHWSAASAIAMIMGILQVGFLTLYMRLVGRKKGAARVAS